jgi:hypothetical protein
MSLQTRKREQSKSEMMKGDPTVNLETLKEFAKKKIVVEEKSSRSLIANNSKIQNDKNQNAL